MEGGDKIMTKTDRLAERKLLDAVYNPGDTISRNGNLPKRRHVLIIPTYGQKGVKVDTNEFPPENRVPITGYSEAQETQTMQDTTF